MARTEDNLDAALAAYIASGYEDQDAHAALEYACDERSMIITEALIEVRQEPEAYPLAAAALANLTAQES